MAAVQPTWRRRALLHACALCLLCLPSFSQANVPVANISTAPAAFIPSTIMDVNNQFIGNNDFDSTGSVTVGDQIDFQITATNVGNVTLTNVQLVDDRFATTITCASLVPGNSCVLTGGYIVTMADQSAGQSTNTGTATANEIGAPIGSSASVAVEFFAAPSMTLTAALASYVDADGSGTVSERDILTLAVTARNTGNSTLTNLQIDAPELSPNFTVCSGISPGGSCVLSGTRTVTRAEAVAGQVSTDATAFSAELPTPFSSPTLLTPVFRVTAMTVDKILLGFVDNDGSGDVTGGDQLDYQVSARNTGGNPLSNVLVSDDHVPDVQSCPNLMGFTDCILGVSYVVTANDVLAGQVVNVGRATSTEIPGPLTATVTTPVNAPSPSLSLISGDGLAGYGGQTSGPLVVELRDGFGNPMAGATINWTRGNAGTTVTDANGRSSNTVSFGGVTGFLDVMAAYLPASIEVHFTLQSISARLQIVAGDNQTGFPGSILPQPLVVLASDDGNVIGAPLTWTVNQGNATVSPTASNTDADTGEASAVVTLGTSAGPVQVTVVRADGSGESVVFNLTAGGTRSLALQSGADQSGPISSIAPAPLVVRLTDGAGNPVAGQLIDWSLTGAGALSAAGTPTDSNGLAQITLTFGASAGAITVTASTLGTTPVSFNATALLDRTLLLVSGGGQVGAPGAALPAPLVIRAQDNGIDASGIGIQWTVTSGVASVIAGGPTDGAGLTSAAVTLGAVPGDVVVRAERIDDPTVFVLFAAGTAKLQLIPGLTADERELAEVVDDACSALAGLAGVTPAQADLLARCQDLATASTLDSAAAADALDELFPGLQLAMAESAFHAAQAQFQNLKLRIAALRSGTHGKDFNGLAFTGSGGSLPLGALTQSLLGDDDPANKQDDAGFEKWGFFAAGNIGRGEAEQGSSRPGYDYDIEGLTAGADYRYSDTFIVGAALGFTKQDTDLVGNRGQLDMHGWSLSGYATYYRDDSWYGDAVLTWGHNQFDLLRRINYTVPLPGGGDTTVDQVARSNVDGSLLQGAVTFGRDYQANGWSIGPYGRLLYTRLDFDTIRESLDVGAGSGLALQVDARRLSSVASQVGAKFTYAHSTAWGVVTPHLQLEWEHEFRDDPEAITARFLADPNGTPFGLAGEAIDTDYFRASLGLSVIMSRGRSGFVLYERTFARDGLSQDNIGFGIRFEF